MVEVTRVEMKIIEAVFVAGENDRQPEPIGKASLIIDATSSIFSLLGKVGYEKTRSANSRDDFIFYSVNVLF